MNDFNTSVIVPESFALINGDWFLVLTTVDNNGDFFVSDTKGGERQFNATNVDSIVGAM